MSKKQDALQPKYIWKESKHDGLLPITKYMKVQEVDPNKMVREQINQNVNKSAGLTKLTTFTNNASKDTTIRHNKIIQKFGIKDKKEEEKKDEVVKQEKEELKQKSTEDELPPKEEIKEQQQEVVQQEEEIKNQQEEEPAEEDENQDEVVDIQNTIQVGSQIFLIDKKVYCAVKSKIDSELYECQLKNPQNENEMLRLRDKINEGAPDEMEDVPIQRWTASMVIVVRCILTEDKAQTVSLRLHSNDKAMAIAEQIADLFGETKYSISFFFKGQKVNLNDRIADLGIGYPFIEGFEGSDSVGQLLCLKGGVDAPKVFNRFKKVDAPERQLTYISDQEAFDAISYTPTKDIKFAGFSVFAVHDGPELASEFTCIYKVKIGTEQWPEKQQDFTQADVSDKMADIMLDKVVTVNKNSPITIGVRFLKGEDYFCTTLLGYLGEEYRDNKMNEECCFEVIDTVDSTKGETDVTFGQVPRIHYFDCK